MRRRALLLAAAAVLVAAAAWADVRWVRSGMVECSATLAHVAVADPGRENLTLLNAGTIHANIGRAPHSQANFQGLTLHAGSSIEFRGFQAGLDCRTAGGTTAIEVLEELGR